MKKKMCKKLGLKPKMRLVEYVVIGVDPVYMGVGQAIAVPQVLKKSEDGKKTLGFGK